MTVPAFFYQAFAREKNATGEVLNASGPPEWRIRFTATEPGTYSLSIFVRDRSGLVESGPVRFEARSAADHGYIQVSPRDPHYFEFRDGTLFFAIGENMASGSLDDYER